MSEPSNLKFSVVIPVHNEEADVQELARRVADSLSESYEIVFVDDGSTDRTWQRLEEIYDPGRIRLIRFRRNFGKAAALMAGFAVTRGELVFTMDGDLQDDPAEMSRFVAKIDEGYDIISGWKKRRYDPLNKVVASRLFNFVVRKATRVDLHDMNCGFKCYRGELARQIRIYGELHRFIPALAAYEGHRVGEIEVQHHARQHGRSKYGFSRLFKGCFDLVTVLLTTTYRTRPAHGFGWAALALWAVAAAPFLLSFFPIEIHLGSRHIVTAGPLQLLALFLGLSGVISLAAGFVAEVVVRDRFEAAPSAQYSVEEQLD